MKDTILNPLSELPNDKPFPKPSALFSSWDVMVNGKPYIVGAFKDYPYCILSRGCNDVICNSYCWPRGEEPTRENIVQYSMPENGPVDWGISYEHYNTVKYKYEPEIQSIGMITITRNGKKFYSFRGSMGLGIDKARCIIERISTDLSIDFSTYDYINKEIIGRECYFYGYKAKITDWCDGQGCAIIECAETDSKRKAEALAKWEAVGCDDDCIKIDIIDPYPGTGFTWFNPEKE